MILSCHRRLHCSHRRPIKPCARVPLCNEGGLDEAARWSANHQSSGHPSHGRCTRRRGRTIKRRRICAYRAARPRFALSPSPAAGCTFVDLELRSRHDAPRTARDLRRLGAVPRRLRCVCAHMVREHSSHAPAPRLLPLDDGGQHPPLPAARGAALRAVSCCRTR
jgi:hypothetical protein